MTSSGLRSCRQDGPRSLGRASVDVPCNEEVLGCGLRVGYALEHGCERVGYEDREDEFHCGHVRCNQSCVTGSRISRVGRSHTHRARCPCSLPARQRLYRVSVSDDASRFPLTLSHSLSFSLSLSSTQKESYGRVRNATSWNGRRGGHSEGVGRYALLSFLAFFRSLNGLVSPCCSDACIIY